MSTGLFLGLTTVDILYGVARHPEANEKLKANWQLAFAGGPAANAAVAFAAFGNTSILCTGIGAHPSAELAKRDLVTQGVHIQDYIADPLDPPVLSSVLVNLVTGDRSVIYSNTDDRYLSNDINYRELLFGASTLLLDGYYLEQAVVAAQMAEEMGVCVILDGGSWKQGLENLLPYVDYAICSSQFLPPGCSRPNDIFTFLAQYRMSGCAVSRGGESLLVKEKENTRTIEVPVVDVVDTLGAGDILHGAFCHYCTSNSFFTSLSKAAEIASRSCSFFGTRQWIETLSANE